MNKPDVKRLVAVLKAAYPRQELPPETVAIYAEMLADLDAETATAAVKRAIQTSRFFPTIAEIRNVAAELREHAEYTSSVWADDQPAEVTEAAVLQLSAARQKIGRGMA